MYLERFDVYALKRYSFTIQRTNSYFTITTILLSTGIIALAVAINYQVVSYLWLLRQQLTIKSNKSLRYPMKLTDTPICYSSVISNTTVPKILRIYDAYNVNYTFPYIDMDSAFKKYPQLVQSNIKSPFACVNLEGFHFTLSNYYLIFQFDTVNGTNLYIPTISIDDIINQNYPKFTKHLLTTMGPVDLDYFIYAEISDSLSIAKDPEVYSAINRFRNRPNQMYMHYLANKPGLFCFSFTLDFQTQSLSYDYLNDAVMTQYYIKRQNLGIIVGSILAWISILSLVASFIVGPVMEKALNLVQIESIFYHRPQNQNPSLFKYMAAALRSGLFQKEDKFVVYDDILQKIKDISYSLKGVKSLKRLVKQSDDQIQILGTKEQFDKNDTLYNSGVDVYNNKQHYYNLYFQSQQVHQPEPNLIARFRKGIFKFLDSGSDLISVLYVGIGHGSKFSISLSLIVFIGFLVFIVLFGVFETSTTQDYYYKLQDYTSTTIKKSQLVFFAKKLHPQAYASIIDANFNVIKNLKLVKQNCAPILNNIYQLIKTKYDLFNHLCYQLNEDVQIIYSQDSSKARSIYSFLVNEYDFFNVRIAKLSQNNFEIAFKNDIIYPNNDDAITTVTHFQVLQQIENNKIIRKSSLLKLRNRFIVTDSEAARIFAGQRYFIVNQKTVSGLFNVLQSIWGFATVVFTVFLIKITKYINISQKNINIEAARAAFRENVCIYLAKLNGLTTGKYKYELDRVKYYLKEMKL